MWSLLISRFVVGLLCLHRDELIRFDNVGSQVVAIHATRIETDGFPATPWFGRRPVSEKHNLFTVINVIPRRTFFALAIASECSDARHVAGRLRIEFDVGTETCVYDDVRVEIDCEWQPVEEDGIS